MTQGNDASGLPQSVPPVPPGLAGLQGRKGGSHDRWRWRERGHFWFVSQLLWRLMRPNAKLRQDLREAKDAMGWPLNLEGQPLLSVHVRRGDACNAEQVESKKRRCEPLSAYMPHIERLCQTYGYRHIYLATDDEEIIKETQDFPKYHWLFVQDLERGAVKKLKWEVGLMSLPFVLLNLGPFTLL